MWIFGMMYGVALPIAVLLSLSTMKRAVVYRWEGSGRVDAFRAAGGLFTVGLIWSVAALVLVAEAGHLDPYILSMPILVAAVPSTVCSVVCLGPVPQEGSAPRWIHDLDRSWML